MPDTSYIQVLLPLRLEWDPYYSLPEGLQVQPGARVRVLFAGRLYTGVVSATGVTPPRELLPRVLPIREIREDLPPVAPSELRFWQALAAYYLCSVGEVYKAACPAVQNKVPKRPRPLKTAQTAPQEAPPRLTSAQQSALEGIRAGFSAGKTVLLHGVTGSGKTELYLALAQEYLQKGKSVLYLVPEIAVSRQLEQRIAGRFPDVLLYHSEVTDARRRKVAKTIREADAYLVLGTRSALLLPHRNLGLVIVDEEQDCSYKQDAPAPRYHAREAAIMLSGMQDAHVLLGSATPSLESLYNAERGVFTKVNLKERFRPGGNVRIEIVNVNAEQKKLGMLGNFSKKLIALMQEVLSAGEQVLLLAPRSLLSGDPPLSDELAALFPGQTHRILLGSAFSGSLRGPHTAGLVAVLGADAILSRQDFRADERAFQLLEQFRGLSDHLGVLAIQTREAGHPVFQRLLHGQDATERLLQERLACHLPPYTRLVDVCIKDSSDKRGNYQADQLARTLLATPELAACVLGRQRDLIRLALPRDQHLRPRKQLLAQLVTAHEKRNHYDGHIVLDVDPV